MNQSEKYLISIITVVFNRVEFIGDAIESLNSQTYSNIEHIFIDGGSTDGTLSVIKKKSSTNSIIISESDNGIYDALNKGINLSHGEVIGILHSDDIFSDPKVLSDIVDVFSDVNCDAVYGNLVYVSNNDTNKIIRYWKSGDFNLKKIKMGWMPPHPALFLRRSVINRYGTYDTQYRIAADYDAILRYFFVYRINVKYLNRILVKMRIGGSSNKNLNSIVQKMIEDLSVLKKNHVGGLLTLLLKNLTKVPQLFYRKKFDHL